MGLEHNKGFRFILREESPPKPSEEDGGKGVVTLISVIKR